MAAEVAETEESDENIFQMASRRNGTGLKRPQENELLNIFCDKDWKSVSLHTMKNLITNEVQSETKQ